MLGKAKHKTRLTQNKKQNTQVMQKQKQEEREESDRIEALFLPQLGRTFPLSKPLNQQ